MRASALVAVASADAAVGAAEDAGAANGTSLREFEEVIVGLSPVRFLTGNNVRKI